MYIDCYTLDVMAKTKLAELRADAARRVVLASLRAPRPSVWAALRSKLYREGRRTGGPEIVSPRPA
jgi:hypothetical protein